MSTKRIGIITGVVIVGVAVGGILLARGSHDEAAMTHREAATTSETRHDSIATNKVTIADFVFSPAKITIKVGTTVTWTNNDQTVHTVTADSGTGPNSGSLAAGDTYRFTYKTAGTFTYHCNFHPDMQGTVVVTN